MNPTRRQLEQEVERHRKALDRHDSALARAEARLAALADIPPEPESGSVVVFNHRFRPRGPIYTYAVIHALDGGWYSTGKQAGTSTWEGLWEFIQSGDNPGPVRIAHFRDMASLTADE